MEHPQDGKAGANGVARLDADEAGHLAVGVRLEEGRGVVGEAHVVRVLGDEALDQVDLLQGDLHQGCQMTKFDPLFFFDYGAVHILQRSVAEPSCPKCQTATF